MRTIRSAFKRNDFSKLKLSEARISLIANHKLDDDIRVISFNSLSVDQKKKWASKVEAPVVFNRLYVYLGKRFREYQRSPAPFALATISFFALFLLTLFTFSFVNFSIFKIDRSAFDISGEPFFFSFIWYSFNAFVNNFIREIIPVAPLSWSVWMLNCCFSFLLLSVVISLYFSVSSKRKAQELDLAIRVIETESNELEAFIKSEYHVASVDEAALELEKIEASLFKLFLWATEGKPFKF